MPDQIISQEGYDKLQKEYDYLVNVKRRETADRIQVAKDMGDLSENAEYSEAKDEQSFNEGRIAELSQMLKNLTVVQNGTNKDTVGMGSKVTVKSINGEKQYVIVSFNEADPMTGKISNESPLGRSFLHRKKGETVKVTTPKGEIEYTIMKIG
jgi:transcription elongation factor GreA